jgi:hypothetical protein
MSIVVSITTDGGTPLTWTSTDEARTSLDAFRVALIDAVPTVQPDGVTIAYVPTIRYASIEAMIMGEFKRSQLNPALQKFTPGSLTTAAAVLAAAKVAYSAALAGLGSTAPPLIRNMWPSSTTNVLDGGCNQTDARYFALHTAPDGSNTAREIVETNPGSGSVVHQHYWYWPDFGAGTFTISMHFKASVNRFVYLRADQDGSTKRVWFDLSSGVVGTNTFSGTTTTGMVSLPNGWYRCFITFTCGSSLVAGGCGHANADGVSAYVGTDGNGVYQWGQQIEKGPLTDYQGIVT